MLTSTPRAFVCASSDSARSNCCPFSHQDLRDDGFIEKLLRRLIAVDPWHLVLPEIHQILDFGRPFLNTTYGASTQVQELCITIGVWIPGAPIKPILFSHHGLFLDAAFLRVRQLVHGCVGALFSEKPLSTLQLFKSYFKAVALDLLLQLKRLKLFFDLDDL